jgi:nucleotide-binding universal stress UspA family protein
MLSKILVPLDGSQLAERALPVAEWLAQASRGHIILVRAVQASTFPGIDAREAQVSALADAQAYLDERVGDLTANGLTVETATPYGEPAPEILEEIQLRQADLVVMATHGRSGVGRLVYGSVADAVLHRSPVPVVMVPAASVQLRSPDKPPVIVVPLDGSELAETSLAPASELANQLGAALVLVQVVALPPYAVFGEAGEYSAFDPDTEAVAAQQYLGAVARRLGPTLDEVHGRTEIGDPVDCIVEAATDQQAALIVMATRGRTGVARAVLGSVATGVLRRTTIPLMLVCPDSGLKRSGSPGRVGSTSRAPLDLRLR